MVFELYSRPGPGRERGNVLTRFKKRRNSGVKYELLPIKCTHFTITLRYLIIVAQRLFILRKKLAENHQNLAILCNKVKNLQATTYLIHYVYLIPKSKEENNLDT